MITKRLFASVVARRLRQNLSAYASLRDGNVATVFALSLFPLMGMVGAAVDYGNALRVQTSLQSALDSGVIAGAARLSDGAQTATITTVVANFVASKVVVAANAAPTVTTTVDRANNKVHSKASVNVPTNFMRVFGVEHVPMSVVSEATFGSSKAEIVIALDVTGSMGVNGKLVAAQNAAIGLVNTLYTAANATSRVKVAFVPFNTYVNIGPGFANAPWLTSTAPYSTPYPAGCYDTYPNAVYGPPTNAIGYNDGVPYTYTTNALISAGAPVNVCYPAGTDPHTWTGAVGSRNYPLDLQATVDAVNKVPAIFDIGGLPNPLVRLTNNPVVINAQIGATVATGETYIAPALLWSWRLLAPGAPFNDGAPYGQAKKIVVLMTDGANTASPDYPTHNASDVTAANALMASTCANMKASPNNISVFTIAFQVTDPTIQGVLSNCASGPPNYFNATTIADMQAAFAKIGAELVALRVSK